ncbi:MAG: hypothetical protein M1818_000706 [Claussenomyces sp. TS43310]|nr:MAG: hypothetical protein M1818_000706 [Claussenomyces sp. TS43310]
MSRKAFVADIASAKELNIPGISNIVRGAEDGDLEFLYTPDCTQPPISIQAVATDVSGYPSENKFFLCTLSSSTPLAVNAALDKLQGSSTGIRIPRLLETTASQLQKALTSGSDNDLKDMETDPSPTTDDSGTGSPSEDTEAEEYWPDSPSQPRRDVQATGGHGRYDPREGAEEAFDRRIKRDLRAVVAESFRIGIISGMRSGSHSSIYSMSVQVARLGLSDDAIQAWDLKRNQYIVLLVKFLGGYKTFEMIVSEPAASFELQFRIGVSSNYKPSIVEANAAFTTATTKHDSCAQNGLHRASTDGRCRGKSNDAASTGYHSLFISGSLNKFMDDEFTSLLKTRVCLGVDWDGAKKFNDEKIGTFGQPNIIPCDYVGKDAAEPNSIPNNLPLFLNDDHVRSSIAEKSLPLISMQFAMRYLVCCTQFCLVCHNKTKDDFEAIKPYVCANPLCLYQYMSLGFGPGIEHEILTQPYVVDLLLSFCYSAAKSERGLREYPTGMSLPVPPVATSQTPLPQDSRHPTTHDPVPPPTDSLDVKFNPDRRELIVEDYQKHAVHVGDWVALTVPRKFCMHHRVVEVIYSVVKLAPEGAHVPLAEAIPSLTPAVISLPNAYLDAKLAIYNKNFDDFDDTQKRETISILLETMPTVREMEDFLQQRGQESEPTLRQWANRISPAALGLLRWVVASNRSCIVQIDRYPGQMPTDPSIKLDQKVSHMEGWVQFRFAQGAPDKEQRFRKALQDVQTRLQMQHSTIFAWHGSPLPNWHSIIRTGLDFSTIVHGRAFGNGVYHSLQCNTSMGYALSSGPGNHMNSGKWPKSGLDIVQAMCLNEIINAPQEFQSFSPHIVVQYVDWIQVRYLFVRLAADIETDGDKNNEKPPNRIEIEQDKTFCPRGIAQGPVGIPRSAFPASRNFRCDSLSSMPGGTPDVKRLKIVSYPGNDDPMPDGLDHADTDTEDVNFLLSDDDLSTAGALDRKRNIRSKNGPFVSDSKEHLAERSSSKRKSSSELVSMTKSPSHPKTDFIPGSLDPSTLQMLQPPSYATSAATRTLNRALKDTLESQEKVPLHELGWYIDGQVISNVYQWIVELHSFEPHLPIAKDMKAAGVSSVVLEVRFGKDYPMSPPFVRVIRPRFLSFAHGGGGHVTGGGALCMELLTNSGWSAVSSLESVFLQVRMAIMNTEPRPARLAPNGAHKNDYGVGEAIEAYIRACNAHGWQVPPDFKDFASPSTIHGDE